MNLRTKQELSRILDRLSKPLEFAARDDFALIGKVRGLGELAKTLCGEARKIDELSEDAAKGFSEVEMLFDDFDELEDSVKRERIIRGSEILEWLVTLGGESGRASERELSPQREEPLDMDASEAVAKVATPVQFVKGVGPRLGERLEKKGISTVEDLLYYLPLKYEDRRKIKKISELEVGCDEVTSAEVMAAGEVRYGRRKLFEVAVSDGTGILKLKWFNYRASYMKRYKAGLRLMIFGKVTAFGRQKEVIHPDIELVEPGEESLSEAIVPVYSQIDNLHLKTIRKIVGRAVNDYARFAVGATPKWALSKRGYLTLASAIREAHAPQSLSPDDESNAEKARKSLVYDEFFSLELGLLLKRRGIRKEPGISFKVDGAETADYVARLRELLPFTLTDAQERVLAEVGRDMASPHPMNRLLQGDVGSGKTIVGLISMLYALGSGYQSALMAPTEILAEQHYLSIMPYAEALGIKSVLLTSGQKTAEKKRTLEVVKNGEASFVVGTHALIQKGVEFKRLGLVVVDEQHRFGVVQRAELRDKGSGRGIVPDVLVMTATPIPRTLSMTVFGDLDVSTIDSLPSNRKPITTRLVKDTERDKAYRLVVRELSRGSQAYVVCPLVEESEELSLRDATNVKERLASGALGEFKVSLLHGRMKQEEKEEVMASFKAGETDVLVATTVIEVGVDVPNATVMVIEHAERFGLAQLHQLRGRVGRGRKESYCILLAAYTPNEETWHRLKVIESTLDGFKIAEEDMKIRGPGDFIGKRQSGLPAFRTADLISDLEILRAAREDAATLIKENPELSGDEGERIKTVIGARWKGRLELAEVG